MGSHDDLAGTLVFVHGTGVRKAGYDKHLEAIRAGCVAGGLGGIDVIGVPWGDTAGVSTDLADETLPPRRTRAATDALEPAEEAAAAWDILLEDPLFELRLAGADAAPATGAIAIGELAPADVAAQRLRAAATAPGIDLAATGVSRAELAAAIAEVAQSSEFADAAGSATAAGAPADLADAVARAVVASILHASRLAPPGEAPALAYRGDVRDALVGSLAAAIDPGGTRGVGSWLGHRVGDFVARRATTVLQARRETLTTGSLPFLGDLLYYQKRGQAIRELIGEALASAAKPVVALGHSLGGIMLVDLLTQERPPHVAGLVTVGSQSPMLYAIDALDRMRRGTDGPDPVPFTPWLNIYDRADMLSFVATRVFEGIDGIRDEEVASGVPFPAAHSAYFHQDRTFELICEAWPV